VPEGYKEHSIVRISGKEAGDILVLGSLSLFSESSEAWTFQDFCETKLDLL
jgi:hypothetical protein